LIGGFDTTGFNLGGQFDFDEHNHLLFSAGRGFQNAAQTNLLSWYLGRQVTYRSRAAAKASGTGCRQGTDQFGCGPGLGAPMVRIRPDPFIAR